jgi:hypothetical protein
MSQGESLNAEERNARLAMKAIRGEIKRVLDSWDPLYLRGLPGFQQEYHPFVGPLSVLVRKGAEKMEIARHLRKLMMEEWKLPEDRAKCVEVAEKIYRVGTLFHPK